MLNGKEKVQLLLNLLGPLSQNVLTSLSPESANQITINIENAPKVNDADLRIVLEEILAKAKIFEAELEQIIREEEKITKSESIIIADQETNKPRQKDAVGMAKIISQQKPRIIAFLLSKLDEDMANKVKAELSAEILASLQTIEVEYVPYSDKIYQSLCKQLFENNN